MRRIIVRYEYYVGNEVNGETNYSKDENRESNKIQIHTILVLEWMRGLMMKMDGQVDLLVVSF